MASADNHLRQLRGAGDPTPVDDTRGSKQERDASFNAEAEGRELNRPITGPSNHLHGASTSSRARSVPHPRSAAANTHHTQQGPEPSHYALPISRVQSTHVQGSKPRATYQKMKGGGLASPRHVKPGVHEKVNPESSTNHQNQERNGRPVMTEKQGTHHTNNGRQPQHGVNSAAQGSIQHVGGPSSTTGGDQNATRAFKGKRSFDNQHPNNSRQPQHGINSAAQGSLQHVGRPSSTTGVRQNATRAFKGKRSFDNQHPNNGRQSQHGINSAAQGSIQHVGSTSHSTGGYQNTTRTTQGERLFDSRIVGGFAAGEGEYKFIATLYFSSFDGSLSFGCGGSLIAPDVVLTAAHCGSDSVASVRIGSNSLENGGDLRGVASQCVHPMYNATETSNDYMLVKLDSPVNTSVYPIIQLNQEPSLPQEDDMLTVIGFGVTKEEGDVSQTLQKVEVPMNSFELCNQQYGGTVQDEIQFCAGFVEGGKDSCQGDSGGPIFEMRGSTPVQVGVVSFGEGCAEPDKSGVYARVTGAYEWIQDTMAKLDAGDMSGCGEGPISSGINDNSFLLLNNSDSSGVGDDRGLWTGRGGVTVFFYSIFLFLLI